MTAKVGCHFAPKDAVFYKPENAETQIFGTVVSVHEAERQVLVHFDDGTDVCAPYERVRRIGEPSPMVDLGTVVKNSFSVCEITNNRKKLASERARNCVQCGTEKKLGARKGSRGTSEDHFHCRKCLNKSDSSSLSNPTFSFIQTKSAENCRQDFSKIVGSQRGRGKKGCFDSDGVKPAPVIDSDQTSIKIACHLCFKCQSFVPEVNRVSCLKCMKDCHLECLDLNPPPMQGDKFWYVLCYHCGEVNRGFSSSDPNKKYSCRRKLDSWSDVACLLISCLTVERRNQRYFSLLGEIMPFMENNLDRLHLPKLFTKSENKRGELFSALSKAKGRFIQGDKSCDNFGTWALKMEDASHRVCDISLTPQQSFRGIKHLGGDISVSHHNSGNQQVGLTMEKPKKDKSMNENNCSIIKGFKLPAGLNATEIVPIANTESDSGFSSKYDVYAFNEGSDTCTASSHMIGSPKFINHNRVNKPSMSRTEKGDAELSGFANCPLSSENEFKKLPALAQNILKRSSLEIRRSIPPVNMEVEVHPTLEQRNLVQTNSSSAEARSPEAKRLKTMPSISTDNGKGTSSPQISFSGSMPKGSTQLIPIEADQTNVPSSSQSFFMNQEQDSKDDDSPQQANVTLDESVKADNTGKKRNRKLSRKLVNARQEENVSSDSNVKPIRKRLQKRAPNKKYSDCDKQDRNLNDVDHNEDRLDDLSVRDFVELGSSMISVLPAINSSTRLKGIRDGYRYLGEEIDKEDRYVTWRNKIRMKNSSSLPSPLVMTTNSNIVSYEILGYCFNTGKYCVGWKKGNKLRRPEAEMSWNDDNEESYLCNLLNYLQCNSSGSNEIVENMNQTDENERLDTDAVTLPTTDAARVNDALRNEVGVGSNEGDLMGSSAAIALSTVQDDDITIIDTHNKNQRISTYLFPASGKFTELSKSLRNVKINTTSKNMEDILSKFAANKVGSSGDSILRTKNKKKDDGVRLIDLTQE